MDTGAEPFTIETLERLSASVKPFVVPESDWPKLLFGRKPRFKNIRTLSEQEVEALKEKK